MQSCLQKIIAFDPPTGDKFYCHKYYPLCALIIGDPDLIEKIIETFSIQVRNHQKLLDGDDFDAIIDYDLSYVFLIDNIWLVHRYLGTHIDFNILQLLLNNDFLTISDISAAAVKTHNSELFLAYRSALSNEGPQPIEDKIPITGNCSLEIINLTLQMPNIFSINNFLLDPYVTNIQAHVSYIDPSNRC